MHSQPSPYSDQGLLKKAFDWSQEGFKVAIAIVVETWGSAPRPKGGVMIFRQDGLFEGSVSGGCVEGDVLCEAESAIKNKSSEILEFSISNEKAWEVGLACGGAIKILVTFLDLASLKEIEKATSNINNDITSCLKFNLLNGQIKNLDGDEIAELSNPSSHIKNTENEKSFFAIYHPQTHLIIIGAVHIAQALISLALELNYKITLIDPRGLFAQEERFQNVELIEDWPDTILSPKFLTENKALVTLTHDPKIDDVALKIGLQSKAFYIGSLGSKKTHASRCDRMKESGFEKAQIDRIHGPIGLDLGSKTPSEIALSILAEIEGYRTGKFK